jgi:hypothetical protein
MQYLRKLWCKWTVLLESERLGSRTSYQRSPRSKDFEKSVLNVAKEMRIAR